MTRTLFSTILGMCETFVEVDGPVRGWFAQRIEGGMVLGLGRVQATFCPTRAGAKLAMSGVAFLAVDAACTLAGHLPWLTADPLELALWAVTVRKLTA